LPSSEQHCEPEEHRATLTVGELVLEPRLGAAVVREDDPVAGIELGCGGRLRELELDRLALVGSLRQPQPHLVAADVVGFGGALARPAVGRQDLGLENVAGLVEPVGALADVAGAAERDHADEGDRGEHRGRDHEDTARRLRDLELVLRTRTMSHQVQSDATRARFADTGVRSARASRGRDRVGHRIDRGDRTGDRGGVRGSRRACRRHRP
jgi:hypothetical protein